MSARPFMQPATEKAKPKIRRFFKSESLIKWVLDSLNYKKQSIQD
jgi:hypothetical protein